MYVVKNEPIRQANLDLAAAFKKAKGFSEERSMTSCGLGWFASHVRDEAGMKDSEIDEIVHRFILEEQPELARVVDFLTAAGGKATIKETLDKCKGDDCAESEVASALRSMLNRGWATLGREMEICLRHKGEFFVFFP